MSPRRWGGACVHPGRRGEELRELGTRADAELRVHLAQVVLDRLRAEEERRGGLARRSPFDEQETDLELLRREGAARVGPPPADGLARRLQLHGCSFSPPCGSEVLERVEC